MVEIADQVAKPGKKRVIVEFSDFSSETFGTDVEVLPKKEVDPENERLISSLLLAERRQREIGLANKDWHKSSSPKKASKNDAYEKS